MSPDQAKKILLLFRPHTTDTEDPQVLEALELAKVDPELARWLEQHHARQAGLREKFRQIPIPAGLKEQIISEHAASLRRTPYRRQVTALASVLAIVLVVALAGGWVRFHSQPADDTLAIFQQQMAGYALRGYAMDLTTNDAGQIRSYLKQRQSPADYSLAPSLSSTAQSGCAVESWQADKVSMICFKTGRPLAPGTQSDLWLFVADQNSVKGAPATDALQITRLNRLVTATWVKNGKLYFLAMEGTEEELRRFL